MRLISGTAESYTYDYAALNLLCTETLIDCAANCREDFPVEFCS
jgi:hypothetical protein